MLAVELKQFVRSTNRVDRIACNLIPRKSARFPMVCDLPSPSKVIDRLSYNLASNFRVVNDRKVVDDNPIVSIDTQPNRNLIA